VVAKHPREEPQSNALLRTTLRYLLRYLLDTATNKVLEDLASVGVLGKNKAEVGSAILSHWIWTNLEKLTALGVRLPGKRN